LVFLIEALEGRGGDHQEASEREGWGSLNEREETRLRWDRFETLLDFIDHLPEKRKTVGKRGLQ